jgi:hypothetical protein
VHDLVGLEKGAAARSRGDDTASELPI